MVHLSLGLRTLNKWVRHIARLVPGWQARILDKVAR